MEKLSFKELVILKCFLDSVVTNAKSDGETVVLPKYFMGAKDLSLLNHVKEVVSSEFWNKEIE